ncbi:MAG TPA: polysaccharide pyruvyl transferase family protein [Niallia sp.]|nr:polysaccharide pyruvyl transferase family protein [Niallia sp.]
MKKIMVYAYTKFNLGDDLFIKILCERYPNTNFILYAPSKYKSCFKEIKNLRCFPSDSLITRSINYFFRKCNLNNFIEKFLSKSCDGGVYIGGSLFIQGERWKEYFEQYTSTKNIKNKPFFLLGANFGPYQEKEYYSKHKELFSEYTDICFREKYSYEKFKDLPNVRIADDIIFQLGNSTELIETNNIVISVIKPSYREHLSDYDKLYFDKMKDLTIYFVEKGFNVTLTSFCEQEGDEEAIEKIMQLIPNKYKSNVKKHYYFMNIEQTVNLISTSKYVIASRFHAMILGWVYNKPVFPIVYSEKMTNVMEDVGFQGYFIDFKNLQLITPERVLNGLKGNLLDVSNQVKNAEKHFEILDKLLVNKGRGKNEFFS